MSKQESLNRHRIIIQKLRINPATFEEIQDKLQSESDLHEMELEVSKRTFQRDLKEIEALYHIDIKFDRSRKVYFIHEDNQDEYNERLFEVIDIFQMLKLNQSISDCIQFSTRKPMGTQHLNGLMYAIQNRFQVQLSYKKFDKEEAFTRIVEPYLLKEFRNRWYLIAYDTEKKEFRTYGADRIQWIRILDHKFKFPQKMNPEEHYKNYFGIVHDNDTETEDIILKFINNQGEYIRTLPLHSSQKILEESGEEMLVKLRMIPTYDFVFELMSMGENVKVVEPQSLADELKRRFRNALNNYN